MFELESVTKRYRDGTVALADLTLTLPSNVITVLAGPAGAGKTTVLQLLNRMVEPTSGTVRRDGVALATMRRSQVRRQTGYVGSPDGLFPHRSVLDNVLTVPRLLGRPSARARSRALRLLDETGVDRRFAPHYPAELSAARRQRVALARALAGEPPILLLDRPFSAIPLASRGDLHTLLRGLTGAAGAGGTTVIMISDEIDEMMVLADRLVVLRKGGLVQVGAPTEVLSAPVDEFVGAVVGQDRGYRSLAFTPAAGLAVGKVRAVRDPKLATSGMPTLVLGPAAQPVGWADPVSERTLPLGSTFDPVTDTLQRALDAALSSPHGLAVAIDRSTGRFVGVVGTDQITTLVRATRLDFARQHDPEMGTHPESEPVVEPEPVVESEPEPSAESEPTADAAAADPVGEAPPVFVPAATAGPPQTDVGVEPVESSRRSTEAAVESLSREPAPELTAEAAEPVGRPPEPGEPDSSTAEQDELFDQEHSLPRHDGGSWSRARTNDDHTDETETETDESETDESETDESETGETDTDGADVSDGTEVGEPTAVRPLVAEQSEESDEVPADEAEDERAGEAYETADEDGVEDQPPVTPTGEPRPGMDPDPSADPADVEGMPNPDEMPGPDPVHELTKPKHPAPTTPADGTRATDDPNDPNDPNDQDVQALGRDADGALADDLARLRGARLQSTGRGQARGRG